MCGEVVDRRFRCERLPIGAHGRQCVERVGGAEDATSERDVFPGEAAWVSGAVPVLVMVVDVQHRVTEMAKRAQDVHANPDMPTDVVEFLSRQWSGFVQYRLADADLAHIVKAAGE